MSSRVSGRRTEARTFAAPSDLADVVASFWTARWDLRGQEPHVTELLGDPCLHFAFEEGDSQPGSRLVGVWTRLWRRKLEGRGSVRGMKLRPGAVRAFVGVPAFRLANRVLPLETVFGSETEALGRAVLGPEDDEEGFVAFAERLRARQLRTDDASVRLAVALADRIAHDPGIMTVAKLAEVAGLGVRVLQRLFRDFVGASPKWVIRRHRLQEVALRLERGDPVTLAALAADLGYSDQAHLAHDFKSVVGRSPSDFSAGVHR